MKSVLQKRLKAATLFILVFLVTSLGFSQGTESFSNIPANANNYATRIWTGDNNETWTAEKARTDQSINGRAIAFTNVNNATLTTSIPGGIGDLTLTTQQIFSGNGGTISVSIDGNIVGTVPYSSAVQTTTISGINASGNVVLILKTDGRNKVAIDDVIWTAGANTPPVISNIVQTPDASTVTDTDEVLVTANITDNDGIASAELSWGTSSGNLSNTIVLTNIGPGDTYSIVTNIPTHPVGTTVYYNIQATDNNAIPATSISAEMSYTVIEIIGVNDNNKLDGIHLFPNPLQGDTFTLYAPNLKGTKVEVMITDISGKSIFNETLNVVGNQIVVSMSPLTSGVYLVTLKSAEQANTYRLIKQ